MKNFKYGCGKTFCMPTVTVSENDKKYIEKLRKAMPLERVPSIKKTIELILKFVNESESDFLEWVRKRGHES